MMIKKVFFLCIIFVFTIDAFGQFNTIISKKKNQTPIIIQPLYGPSHYVIDTKTTTNETIEDSDSTQIPIIKQDVEPTIAEFQNEAIEESGKVLEYNEDEIFAFRQLVALPLDTIIINSKYGDRIHPLEKIWKAHQGIDLYADSSFIYSIMPGKVIRVSSNRRSGNYIVIEHGSYQSIYCHLNKSYVDKGDYVDAGQIIALSGNTGMSTGEHLHFALKHNGKYINPEPFINYITALIDFVNLKLSVFVN